MFPPLSPKPPQHLVSSCAASVHGTLISPSPGAFDLPAVERHKALPVIYFCVLI